MRATVLLDEAAERVDLRADGNASHVVAGVRKRRLERPRFRRWVIDLMKILIDAVLGVAGNAVDFAAAFDDGVLAGRDRHARLLDPFAGVSRLGRDAGHIALLLDRCRYRGDGSVVEAEKNRKLWFSHDAP
jgi:hypothetical protein